MLLNKDAKIVCKNVILVSYKQEHVPKYHSWMQSEELQQLTASEPLSIEEEYEMQKSWLRDENKITFIILDRAKYEETRDEIESMIGDTNLFFASPEDRLCAEAEIMIAEPWARGRKCGWEAILLMFTYSIQKLGIKEYIVKISYNNEISINMFKNMGFVEISKSDIFQEVTLSKIVDSTWIDWLKVSLGDFEIKQIDKYISCYFKAVPVNGMGKDEGQFPCTFCKYFLINH